MLSVVVWLEKSYKNKVNHLAALKKIFFFKSINKYWFFFFVIVALVLLVLKSKNLFKSIFCNGHPYSEDYWPNERGKAAKIVDMILLCQMFGFF